MDRCVSGDNDKTTIHVYILMDRSGWEVPRKPGFRV